MLCLGISLALVSTLPGARAAVDQTIVAVVNEDVISRRDLENRMALYFVTSNVPDTPQTRQQLSRELITSLIDDTLKRQEARRLGISVSRRELESAMANIARQINVPPEQLPDVLASQGANIATLLAQVETQIAWLRTIQRLAGNQISVSDADVDEELNRVRANVGNPEYRVAEIFLPINQASDEPQVQPLADELIRQIRAGARFSAAARSFSQSASAAAGGDLGYVRRGQLPPELAPFLEQMNPGDLSPPIRTPGGIYILLMIDKRTTDAASVGSVSVSLYQLFIPLSPAAPAEQVEAARARATTLSAGASTCDELAERAGGLEDGLSGALGTVDLGQLPANLRQVVAPLQAGQLTPPVRTDIGMVVLMVCDRQQEEASEEVREAIRARLREQKLTIASRRFLRDLWRSSLIDVRR